MLIDRTYFIGELNIVNSDKPAVSSLLDHFINKYEKELLTDVLGLTLYNAFKTGLAADPVPQKWTDLKTGVSYTDLSDKARQWHGIITSVPNESMIANYVYFHFTGNNHTQTSAMGEVKSSNENASIANPSLKMVRAWNEMSKQICELVHFLNSKKDVYIEWSDHDVWCMLRKFRPINEFNI